MKQNVITSIFDVDRAFDMHALIEKLNKDGWFVKQVTTACIDRDKRLDFNKPSIAVTLLVEKED